GFQFGSQVVDQIAGERQDITPLCIGQFNTPSGSVQILEAAAVKIGKLGNGQPVKFFRQILEIQGVPVHFVMIGAFGNSKQHVAKRHGAESRQGLVDEFPSVLPRGNGFLRPGQPASQSCNICHEQERQDKQFRKEGEQDGTHQRKEEAGENSRPSQLQVKQCEDQAGIVDPVNPTNSSSYMPVKPA